MSIDTLLNDMDTVIAEEYTEAAWVDRFGFADYIQNKMLLRDIEKADL